MSLRVIEGLHKDACTLPPIIIPVILNPPRGKICDSQTVYQWHGTGNEGVTAVRVLPGHRLSLRFGNPKVLQKMKDQLLPLVVL